MGESDERAGDGQRYVTEWYGLRIVIYERLNHYQVFIYDPGECEALYTAEPMSLEAAKFTAVDFIATTRFGPSHDLKPEILAAMLVWENG